MILQIDKNMKLMGLMITNSKKLIIIRSYSTIQKICKKYLKHLQLGFKNVSTMITIYIMAIIMSSMNNISRLVTIY